MYLAQDYKFNAKVAIKVLNREFVHNDNIRKRFLAEARSMYRMSHSNIVKVTDLIEEIEQVAFVMEYIEGETLKSYLDRKGKLSEEEIVKLFVQMLESVEYVHGQNLIHRDIKLSNFMLDKLGRIKLMDFGIAKNTDASSFEYTQTGTGMQMGTPMYMSPEQITETKSVTYQSDIYSLGVLLWQIVSGRKPYDAGTLSDFQLKSKIVNEQLPLLSNKWDSMIQKATSKEVSSRYLSCGDWKRELLTRENIQNEETIVDNEKAKLKRKGQAGSDPYQSVGKNNDEGAPIQRTPSSSSELKDNKAEQYNRSARSSNSTHKFWPMAGWIMLVVTLLIVVIFIVPKGKQEKIVFRAVDSASGSQNSYETSPPTARNNSDLVNSRRGCGAYIASGQWRNFMCYNLGAADTNVDPFTPGWEIIGGYWQWGRKKMAVSGPTGPYGRDSNEGEIFGWNLDEAPNGAWKDYIKTVNDPCPSGYRIPTREEWDGLLTNNNVVQVGSWNKSSTNYSSGIQIGEKLFLPSTGGRNANNGALNNRGNYGNYWSSTEDRNSYAWHLIFGTENTLKTTYYNRPGALSVRCIEEE